MIKPLKSIKNENGYFLFLSTIMLLALLTIISIAATQTANTEVQVARNDTIYQRNLYLAEGAAMQAVDRLQNDPNPLDLEFVVPGLKVIDDETFLDHWDTDPGGREGISTLDPDGNTRFLAGYEGTPAGFSLGIGQGQQSSVHGFAIYGRTQKQGVTTIKIGYRKAF
jgi:hypothetical protein